MASTHLSPMMADATKEIRLALRAAASASIPSTASASASAASITTTTTSSSNIEDTPSPPSSAAEDIAAVSRLVGRCLAVAGYASRQDLSSSTTLNISSQNKSTISFPAADEFCVAVVQEGAQMLADELLDMDSVELLYASLDREQNKDKDKDKDTDKDKDKDKETSAAGFPEKATATEKRRRAALLAKHCAGDLDAAVRSLRPAEREKMGKALRLQQLQQGASSAKGGAGRVKGGQQQDKDGGEEGLVESIVDEVVLQGTQRLLLKLEVDLLKELLDFIPARDSESSESALNETNGSSNGKGKAKSKGRDEKLALVERLMERFFDLMPFDDFQQKLASVKTAARKLEKKREQKAPVAPSIDLIDEGKYSTASELRDVYYLDDLKNYCKKHGLKTNVKKAILIKQIIAHLNSKKNTTPSAAAEGSAASAAPSISTDAGVTPSSAAGASIAVPSAAEGGAASIVAAQGTSDEAAAPSSSDSKRPAEGSVQGGEATATGEAPVKRQKR